MGGSSSSSNATYTTHNNYTANHGNVGNDFGALDFSNFFGGGLTLNYGTQYNGNTTEQKFGNENTSNITNTTSNTTSASSKGGDGGGFDVAASVGVGLGGSSVETGDVSQSKTKSTSEESSLAGGSAGSGASGGAMGIKGSTVAIIGGGVAVSAVAAYFILRK